MAGEYEYPKRWIRFGWDNDFVFQTDQYYTNGLKISYISVASMPALIEFLHLNSSFDENTFYEYSITQDIFTPENKNARYQSKVDRPFSSSLLMSTNKIIVNGSKRYIKQSEFQFGVTGKLGGGEWVQNGIHSLLPTSAIVTGWDNQSETNLAINYGVNYEKLLAGNSTVHLSGMLGGKVGLPYTYGQGGLYVRLGNINKYFDHINFYSENELDAFVYSGLKGRIIGYNATIQGGLFSDTATKLNNPEIKHLVYEIDTGINLSYRSMKINFGIKFISAELKGADPHRWGYLSFMFAL
jgi:hypothetical protein